MTEFPLLNAILFAGTGMVLFAVAFGLLSKTLPMNVWKEIVESKNTAAAVLAGMLALGLAIIIAATLH